MAAAHTRVKNFTWKHLLDICMYMTQRAAAMQLGRMYQSEAPGRAPTHHLQQLLLRQRQLPSPASLETTCMERAALHRLGLEVQLTRMLPVNIISHAALALTAVKL